VSGPLAGIRVLDLTRLLPGAYATGLLGDLGAEVIKVEQPGGDPMRQMGPRLHGTSAFSWVTDRNKRSIALNLRDPRGVEAIHRLADEADALIEGFRPGVADRLGVGYDALHARNPALVYCSLSGYGAGGPLEREAGHDLNYLGRAAVLNGSVPAVQIGDLSGSLMAVSGLLAALVHAQRTGAGDHVDISITDAAFALHSIHLGAHFNADVAPDVLGGGYPCYRIYACADGKELTVGALEAPFWREICAALNRPDLAETQYDPAAVDLWVKLFAGRSRDAWLALFAGRDTCIGPVNDLAEATLDPQLTHREMVVELEHPELGALKQVGLPIKLRERPGGLRRPAPVLGEATRERLEAVGYSEDEIERLLADGVAAAPERMIAPQ
jgi:crotonobetainyl-CoA:carnitine CoA-transferase CaiB-like acyl-CoA transferase